MIEFTLNDEVIEFILDAETEDDVPDNVRLLEDGSYRLLETDDYRLLE
jgi:hypothetical protein